MFHDRLKIALELTAGGETLTLPGGQVKAFALELYAYGCRGMVEFWVSSVTQTDAVLPKLTALELVQVQLSIEGVLNLPETPPPPLVVKALVVERAITERSFPGLTGEPVLLRHYILRFEDAAGVLWRQHFPNQLLADSTLETLINQHVVEGITLSMAWDPLTVQRPLICLGLGEERASFYDFLLWLVDKEHGFFTYDYDQQSYSLAGEKPSAGETAKLRSTDVVGLRVRIPEPRRNAARVQNAYTEAATKSTDVTQSQSVSGVLHDKLMRAPVEADVSDRVQLETARLCLPMAELEVEFKQYPLVPFWPGRLLGLQGEFFSSELSNLSTTYRAYQVKLAGRATDQEPDLGHNADSAEYELEMRAAWEAQDDPVAKLPPFEDPRYPIFVEGKIVCETGEATDRLYQIYTDAQSQSCYKVDVPLWTQQILVPFTPNFPPGHFYLPVYKNSRVLLALGFGSAEIVRSLDWGPDVQLPAESQGNHLLFGKNKDSETSFKHVYVDSLPVLSIHRNAAGDTETVEISEGSIVIETKKV